MDKNQEKRDWRWLPAQMPGVAALMAEKRRLLGREWVAECWRQSVVNMQPGWFFAREGPLTVGTPFDDPDAVNFAAMHVTATQALVLIRPKEASSGTHP